MADSRSRNSLGDFDFASMGKSRPARGRPAGGTILQLHIPDGWPAIGSVDEPRFRWARRDGTNVQFGVSVLREIEPADEVIAIAPMSRITYARVKVPGGNLKKIEKMLPFLVEDHVAASPEDVQVVLVDRRPPADDSLVLIADRAWIGQARGELEVQGFPVDRMIVESELLKADKRTEAWHVIRTEGGGFVHMADGEAVALDGVSDDASATVPPMALTLVLDERNALGEIPPEVRVRSAERVAPVHAERWSQALNVRVVAEGLWQPERIDARKRTQTTLLTREPEAGVASRYASAFRSAAIVGAVVFGLHAVATVVDWWRLRSEAASLRAEMNTRFRAVFPDAQNVVNPPLQMTRNLADLRRGAGEPDPSDFVPLLAQVAPRLASAGLKPKKFRYDKGQLQMDLSAAPTDTKETIESRLGTVGLRVQVESVGGGTAVVRIVAAERGA